MTAVTITHPAPAHSADWPHGELLRDIPVKTITGSVCPKHHVRLDGGPVWFRCPGIDGAEGHGVVAASLDHEYHGRAS